MKPKINKNKFRKAPKSTDETKNKNMKPKMKKNKFRKAPKSTDFEDEFVDNDAVSAKWFEEIADDPQDFEPVTEQVLMDFKDEAKKCHDSEVTHYNIKNSKNNPDHRWMKTVMSKGTVADKIAAHTVAIQTNPVCNLETLKNLVNMVKVGRKKECLNAIDVLTEMFLSDLLRPDKKLKEFDVRPLSRLNDLSSGNAITRRKLLTYWYFEDQLKELYKLFVQSLNNVSHDTVDHNKEKAVSCMYKLLAGNPEQEKNLLSFLVNKLGDPSANVVSKTIYSLGQLLLKHPNMQAVVLKEVEKLLFRPNIPMKAQYYGLCFLSQFYLDHDTSEVAKRLIEVYFSFFKACVKKGEVDSRMMSALLTGVKRAYPYAKVELSKISDHIDTIYRIVHIATFNIGLHALCLLYQVSDYANDISNRFYQALYKKLIDPEVLTTTHQAMLLSLIYRSLLKDQETNRIKVFVKRLLQISLNAQPAFACGILYLVSQLMGKKENIQAIGLKQSFGSKMGDDDDDGEEKYQDVKDETMVSMEDSNVPNESVQEVSPDKNITEEEEDVKPDPVVLSEALKASSWYHCQNTFKENRCQEYDPFSRNPLYAGGDKCTYTELIALQNHFHPSVSLFASQILKGDVIQYSGDPLKDFTLIRFLERFVFKNPKKPEDVSKSGAHPTFGKRKLYRPSGVKSIPVNSMSYLSGNEENVPVDELFMYRYLQKKHQEKPIKRGSDDDSDLESVQSEEFEEMLDKMPSMKDANMDDDDDDDLNFMDDVEATMKSNQKQKKSKKNKDEDEPSDDEALSDEDEDDGLSDEDLSGEEDLMNIDDEELSEDDLQDEDMMDLEGLSEDDDDDEDIVFDDDDEPQSTKNSSSKKKHKDLKKGISSLFASAEEFSALLEDEGGSKIAPGGSNVFSNKDNSSVKQIAWEEKRNQYLQGHKRVMGKKKPKGHWKKPNKPVKKSNFKKSKFRK